MSVESKKEIQLEIAHVLFIDIVGYSKLSINDQHAAVEIRIALPIRPGVLIRQFVSTEMAERNPSTTPNRHLFAASPR
jgi:hypothetical protein